jgi:ring-1,2-phenylacetyl-CoA epoxidase subunit PaaD
MAYSSETILNLLSEIVDPEIPVLSIVDLGIIHAINIKEDKSVEITITPTFVGCPAIDTIKNNIIDTLQTQGIHDVAVIVDRYIPWSTNKISEKGKLALKTYGIAPPKSEVIFSEDDLLHMLQHIECPQCSSTNTEIQSPFGTTLCRTIHYCHTCKQSFEHMKHI